jgi:hypothetical protein
MLGAPGTLQVRGHCPRPWLVCGIDARIVGVLKGDAAAAAVNRRKTFAASAHERDVALR